MGLCALRASTRPLLAQAAAAPPRAEPIITPTTKGREAEHDERITCTEVTERGLLDEGTWAQVQEAALAIEDEATEGS